jgi:hypothetical protein
MRWAVVLSALLIMSFARLPVATAGWVAPAPAASTPEDVKSALQQADALYDTRDKPGHTAGALKVLRDLGARHPESYAVQWRLARILFWVAEDTTDTSTHRALGEEGWEAGKKAVAANAEGPEGLYFMAICIGEVAHSVGIVTALTKGLESSFREPLLKAEKINPGVDNGGLYRALGRYKFELPWPKRDLNASANYLHKALEIYPPDLRGRVYLAETLQRRDGAGDADEAKRLLQEVATAPIGAANPAEDARAKQFARDLKAKLGW